MYVIIPCKGAIAAQGTFEDIAELLPSSALASKSQAKQGDDDDDQQHGVCHNKHSMVSESHQVNNMNLDLGFRNWHLHLLMADSLPIYLKTFQVNHLMI